jgi:hypothetical protein
MTTGRQDGWVPPAERARLAAEFGALLRAERCARGWSLRRLAAAVPCHRSTLTYLQAGARRPRRVLLRAVASVLDPDDPVPLGDRLIAAAGPSVVADSRTQAARRVRLSHLAILAGHRPLPSDVARRIGLHRQAAAAWWQSLAVLDRPGALDDPAALQRAAELRDQAWQLTAEAGPAITLVLGRHRLCFGIGR